MSDFRKLQVWQKAHALMLRIHSATDSLRASRFAALKGQMNRAAESVPANIVESRGHDSRKESKRFLRIALNSTTELEYHLIAARDLRAISARQCEELTEALIEVRKMLYGLIKYLRAQSPPYT